MFHFHIYLYSFLYAIVLIAARPQWYNYQHIDVLQHDAWEQTLPYEYRNPFYRTPRVRQALEKSSWFGPGEYPVHSRDAEKISRREIFNILNHAGLLSMKF